MWEYSDKLLDHFYNPRNMGELEDANGVGEVGSIACGDMLKLYIKVDENGVITDAKFKTFGCGSAIASASALTELIIGKTLEEVQSLTNEKIAEYLGGLPRAKMHCSVLGREALDAALRNYRGETDKPSEDEDEGKLVCKCFGITDAKIRRVAKENNLRTVEDVTNFTKAGGACGSCIPEIEDILHDLWKDEPIESQKPEIDETVHKMTNLQKINLIQQTIEQEIRPQLKKDGGDIELIDIEGDLVKVAFRGHCSGCRASQVTLKGFIEAKLREFVTPDIEVIEVR